MTKRNIRGALAAALALITLMCLFAVPANAAGKGDIVVVVAIVVEVADIAASQFDIHFTLPECSINRKV